MNILHLDSSILGANSVSRQLSAGVVARLQAAHPGSVVTYRDLAADPLAHLSGPTFAAAQSPAEGLEPALAEDVARGGEVMAEFLAADAVVIGVAFYNFGVASQLKAWLDRIIVAGVTFRHGADGGVEGLARGKRAVLAAARGNRYGADSPYKAFEHAVSHLQTALGFIGVDPIDVVVAEGLGAGPDHRAAGIAQAEREIAALAA
ncbi:MAG: NAD(P)H-dependent oxidoreductase [Caulobacteraceae bacterium]|nr:NAD(P)H-dependent oxidoreductase [Caulobacter sp.]